MICVDNNFLVLLLKPDAKNPPIDPATGQPVDRVSERMDLLQNTWNTNGEVILIPTPVLSEFMMLSDVESDRIELLERFQNSQNYEIKPFDKTAALELAALYISEKTSKTKQKNFENVADTKTRLKFDRQIIAIAKRNNATAIYSDDDGVRAFGSTHGIAVISTYDLDLPAPPEPEKQRGLFDFVVDMDGTNGQEEVEDEQPQQTEPVTADVRGSGESIIENEAGADRKESEPISAEVIKDDLAGEESKTEAAS